MFEPIVITAYLRGGIISDQWLPLDGVLLYEACRQRYGGGPEASLPGRSTLSLGSDAEHAPTLPLLLIQDGSYRYYACSFAEWGQPYQEGHDYWNKRADVGKYPDVLDTRVHKMIIEQGPYKAYHMPIFYRVAPWVRWWATGNAAKIRALLTGVLALGKKRAYGWGRVARWTVESCAEDRSVWVNDVPQRSVPITETSAARHTAGGTPIFWGYYPPYYEVENQVDCHMPPGIRYGA